MIALLISLLANPAVVSSLVAGGGSLAWFLVSKRSKASQERFTVAATAASRVVGGIAARTSSKTDDLLAVFLAEISRSLAAQGEQMKPTDVEKAKALFQAMHGTQSVGVRKDPQE